MTLLCYTKYIEIFVAFSDLQKYDLYLKKKKMYEKHSHFVNNVTQKIYICKLLVEMAENNVLCNFLNVRNFSVMHGAYAIYRYHI